MNTRSAIQEGLMELRKHCDEVALGKPEDFLTLPADLLLKRLVEVAADPGTDLLGAFLTLQIAKVLEACMPRAELLAEQLADCNTIRAKMGLPLLEVAKP